MQPEEMETLREAIERLEGRGFTRAYHALPGGLLGSRGHMGIPPEDLVVEEIVRFEGESDPGDEAVLFALRSEDGRECGTFVAGYGTQAEPDCVRAVRRLDVSHA